MLRVLHHGHCYLPPRDFHFFCSAIFWPHNLKLLLSVGIFSGVVLGGVAISHFLAVFFVLHIVGVDLGKFMVRFFFFEPLGFGVIMDFHWCFILF